MACGVPVIVSRAGALPEVAGEAALVVDPQNELALADALDQVASDGALRLDLIRRGAARVQQFRWREVARATAREYERAAACAS
jgi:glycosyltransferase involved in cell wall biosynthesis